MVMAKCVKKCLMEEALVGSSVTKPTMADSSKATKVGFPWLTCLAGEP